MRLHAAGLAVAGLLGLGLPAAAEVTRFELAGPPQPVFDGRAFGGAGPYERLTARATLALDPNAFLQQNVIEEALVATASRPASVGHVHLSVGDVDSAHRFYVEQLGFETTTRFGPQALFVSAGGYHHHMAMNTWNSAGAGPRRLARGLGLVRIELPTTDDLGALGERLGHHRIATKDDGRTVRFDDPWLNRIEVSVKA